MGAASTQTTYPPEILQSMRSPNKISLQKESDGEPTVTTAKQSRPIDAAPWLGLVVLLAADILLARYVGFRLTASADVLALAAMPLCLATGSRIYSARSAAIGLTLHQTALLIAYAPLAGSLSYMVAALAFPLIDGRLSALDLALGFDWVHWFTFVVAHRRLDIALQVLYETSGIQIVGVLLWLGLKGHARRLREMVALLVWTSLVIIVLSGLLPAESAWNYHGIGLERAYHFEHFSSLRAGTLRELPLGGGMTGIVTFPSFHTAVSIITVWVVRGLGGFWPLLVLNIGVLLSVPTAGGHYLTDMIAAAFITALLILIRSSGRQSNSGTHV
jgi:hypothetical protein